MPNLDARYMSVGIGKVTTIAGTGSAIASQDVTLTDNAETTFLDSFTIATDDTATRDIIVQKSDGTNTVQVGIFQIPASAGNANNIAELDILRDSKFLGQTKLDANGNKVCVLGPNWRYKVALAGSTNGKNIWVKTSGGKF